MYSKLFLILCLTLAVQDARGKKPTEEPFELTERQLDWITSWLPDVVTEVIGGWLGMGPEPTLPPRKKRPKRPKKPKTTEKPPQGKLPGKKPYMVYF